MIAVCTPSASGYVFAYLTPTLLIFGNSFSLAIEHAISFSSVDTPHRASVGIYLSIVILVRRRRCFSPLIKTRRPDSRERMANFARLPQSPMIQNDDGPLASGGMTRRV